MCGRYSLAKPPKHIRVGHTEVVLVLFLTRPRYNVAPMQQWALCSGTGEYGSRNDGIEGSD